MHRIIYRRFPYTFIPKIAFLSLLCFLSLQSLYATSQNNTVPLLLAKYKKTHPTINRQNIERNAQQMLEKIEHQSLPTQLLPRVRLSLYPITSKKLTPGNVAMRTIKINLPQPIFIIGYDSRSIAWLKKYTNRLNQLHATGYIVNVENDENVKTLRNIAPQLTLTPLNGDILATRLHLTHYPALISKNLIEQ